MEHMSDETQVRIRCLHSTRKKWKKLCADFSTQEEALLAVISLYNRSDEKVLQEIRPGF